jgi:hypothetical protein
LTRGRRAARPGKSVPAGRVLSALAKEGLLLLTDARLPSIAGLVARAPVRGSWWSHPAGQAIFRVSEALADHPDVVVNRLVSGKVTYVHRRLWPALLAVARARAPWQTRRLSRPARSLLVRLTRQGTLRTDRIAGPPRQVSAAARELEDRLLAHTEWIHTERGSHARVLVSWELWARRRGIDGKTGGTARAGEGARGAKEILERVVDDLNARCGADGRLPWQGARPSAAAHRIR